MKNKPAGSPPLEDIVREFARQCKEVTKGFGTGLTFFYAGPTSLRKFLDMGRESKFTQSAGYIPGAIISLLSVANGAAALLFQSTGIIQLHGTAKLMQLPFPVAVLGNFASAGYELFRYARQKAAERYHQD